MKTPYQQDLEKLFTQKGYRWHPQINIVGIRGSARTSDVFDDLLVVYFLQPRDLNMGWSIRQIQEYCVKWGYHDYEDKVLTVDGKPGKRTQSAWELAQHFAGRWRVLTMPCTTEPGITYLKGPLSEKGCAVVVPNQYRKLWKLGYHQSKEDHRALVQHGAEISVYRDNDRDQYAEETTDIIRGWFGINCHRASKKQVLKQIGPWSAGCQVVPDSTLHASLIQICENFDAHPDVKGFFDYTLVKEKDVLAQAVA